MRNIRSTLLGALLVFGVAAAAAAQRPGAGLRPNGRFRNPNALLMRGLKLSDAEKANLKTVQTKYAQQTKALREQFKPQMAGLRDARQRGDTAALKGFRQAMQAERKQERALMQSQRGDLRSALSADNQAKFDANLAKVKDRLAKRGKPDGKKGR